MRTLRGTGVVAIALCIASASIAEAAAPRAKGKAKGKGRTKVTAPVQEPPAANAGAPPPAATAAGVSEDPPPDTTAAAPSTVGASAAATGPVAAPAAAPAPASAASAAPSDASVAPATVADVRASTPSNQAEVSAADAEWQQRQNAATEPVTAAAPNAAPTAAGTASVTSPPPHDAEQDVRDTLRARLSPNELTLGILPNSDGFIDGKLVVHKNYLEHFAFGVKGDYTSHMLVAGVEDQFDAKSVTRRVLVDAKPFEFVLPMPFGDSSMFAVVGGVGALYIFEQDDTSGYKVQQQSTVYFNEVVRRHHIAPSAELGVSGALSPVFSFHLMCDMQPLFAIYEAGRKRYSTFDQPIDYDIVNYDMGLQLDARLLTHGLRSGDFEVAGKVLRISGDYQSTVERVQGNYRYMIKTASSYEHLITDVTLYYKLTYLRPLLDLVPVVSFTVANDRIVAYDGDISAARQWKVGFLTSI